LSFSSSAFPVSKTSIFSIVSTPQAREATTGIFFRRRFQNQPRSGFDERWQNDDVCAIQSAACRRTAFDVEALPEIFVFDEHAEDYEFNVHSAQSLAQLIYAFSSDG
jgi:hypothetical protein